MAQFDVAAAAVEAEGLTVRIQQGLRGAVFPPLASLTTRPQLTRLIIMSKRLQVLLEETELAEVRKAARRQRLTTAAWVRQALRAARRSEPGVDAKKKLDVVRAATSHRFPTADIERMLAEIEKGYMGRTR